MSQVLYDDLRNDWGMYENEGGKRQLRDATKLLGNDWRGREKERR